MTGMIELEDLSKHFGPIAAVDGISLSVERGEVLGFLGPNGAGKSTTMKMVAGFIEPTGGVARVCGFDVTDNPIEVKKRIGYLPEGAPTYGDMTPASFLDFVAAVRGFDGAERGRRIDEVVDKVRLADVIRQPIDTLSKGYKRRVGLAQAMLHDPDVLILDEPTDGLDPNQKHHVRGLIREMAAEKAIVVSTHILEEVEAVCSRAVIIAHGKLLADGTPEALLARAAGHNAVALTLPQGQAEATRADLASVPGVHTVDETASVDGLVTLRVVPAEGRPIIDAVSALLVERKVELRELHVEKGALDDVFREITMPGAGPNAEPDGVKADAHA